MTAIEMFTLTDTLQAFAIALGLLGTIAAIGFAGEAVRNAITTRRRRSASQPVSQPRSAS